MAGGRVLNAALREWLVAEVRKYPEGVSLVALAKAFQRTNFDVTYSCLYAALRELTGTHPMREYPQRLHIIGYELRVNRGRGGRPTPVYAYGAAPNVDRELSKEAVYRRQYRAAERAAEKQRQDKVDVERRRALKRKPVPHEITAALFGMKIRRK